MISMVTDAFGDWYSFLADLWGANQNLSGCEERKKPNALQTLG